MLNDSNHHLLYKKNNKIFSNLLSSILNIDITKPETILQKTFGENNNINNEISNEVYTDPEIKSKTDYVYDPNPTVINNPRVYIYNTHQLENYDDTGYSEFNITPNVLIASYMLKEKLNKLNIKTIVETSNIKEFLNINNWDYNKSYDASRYFLKEIIDKYNNLDLIIDLHRDAIDKEKSTVKINSKSYAKVLFVVGQNYEGYENNLALANKINDLIKNKYPELTRGIITKTGENVNGIYNQDLSDKIILIECGGYQNTMEEVMNTLEILSNIIKNYLGD
ncbi:MAG: stage II sporulation protein P [Bacilli bacterium]|nr:stage II sporulation protein P [Bacilli bacterium]